VLRIAYDANHHLVARSFGRHATLGSVVRRGRRLPGLSIRWPAREADATENYYHVEPRLHGLTKIG